MMDYSINTGGQQRRQRFIISLVIALMLHLLLIGVWKTTPSPMIDEVPVKTLSVKLGNSLSGKEEQLIEKAKAPLKNVEAVEELIGDHMQMPRHEEAEYKAKKVADKKGNNKQTKAPSKAVIESKRASSGEVAKRFIRKNQPTKPVAEVAGSALGNKASAPQQIVASYTQTISLWMNKFKIYPAEAQNAGMQGQAIVRIRIDRQGNIHYRILTQRTPYPVLDKAVLDMVRRANPVPPVPAGYPDQSNFLEFLIPVSFSNSSGRQR